MNKLVKISIIVGLLGGLASACDAGWLKPAFQGSFCAHGFQYVANYDGTINIQTKRANEGFYGNGIHYMAEPVWQTDLSIENINKLHALIDDLQKVEKELNDAGVKVDKNGCDSDCTK